MLNFRNDSVELEAPSEHDVLVRRIGHDLLGPVMHRWLVGLHQYMQYFDDGDTAFLFCARAGVRIEKLYQAFLTNPVFSSATGREQFWVSRLSVAKGVFNRANDISVRTIGREYEHEPISDLVRGLLRHHPEKIAQLDLSLEDYKAHGFNFAGWIKGTTPAAAAVREYLHECGLAFDDYLAEITNLKKRVVLVDSGWQGTMQSLLGAAHPQITWKGIYFGRILSSQHESSITDDVIGALFERNRFEQMVPESAFVLHRHLIESLLEPNGHSIEEVPSGAFKNVADALIASNVEDILSSGDALFVHALEYLRNEGASASLTDVFSRHQNAMKELARMLVFPCRREALALAVKDRSADFGKLLKVPVLIAEDTGRELTPQQRIERALWQAGQIALEHEGALAIDLQKKNVGQASVAGYFDPQTKVYSSDGDIPPSVAIITRTKNRPLLLERAAKSVDGQTYKNYIWVVVNDGGDEDSVREVLERSLIDRRKIMLISNATSVGMEAASNIGIQNSKSDLVVIHDDDDSWESDFLEKTVGFLCSPSGHRYQGVISHSTYVSEEVRGNQIIEHLRQPYMSWVRNLQIAEMASGNLFPPIAFVYHRAMWEKMGGYNENLPVLGDWYFNLAFLLHADIGVLPLPLANYHHRDKGDTSTYANSVIGGITKHEEFAAVARNEFLRQYGSSSSGAGAVLIGYFMSDVRARITSAQHQAAGALQDRPRSQTEIFSPERERLWVVAHVNKELLLRAGRRFIPLKTVKPLEPDASWSEIEAYVRAFGIAVPAPSDFDDKNYLKQNPDVDAVYRAGGVSSGFQHYIQHGRRENRVRPHLTNAL